MLNFLGIVVAILIIGGMIFLHEFGHFLAARLFGIEVEEFGFGLPSYKIATLFHWKGTEFTLHALPLGGFVRPKGENDPNVPGGLAAASPWKRIGVLLAGPFMNLLTAVVVYALLISMIGVSVPPVTIEDVSKQSPAEQAGMQNGDVLLAINGQKIDSRSQAVDLIQANLDKPTEILVDRNGQQISLTATPLSSRSVQDGALGVLLGSATRSATVGEVLIGSVSETALQVALIAYIPVALIQGIVQPKDARIVSIIGIGNFIVEGFNRDVQTRQVPANTPNAPMPTNWVLNFIAMLSVSLGVMNLLPIPALDGGRILFTLPEILIRKRIKPEFENMINGVVMLVLIAFMVILMARDIINPPTLNLP